VPGRTIPRDHAVVDAAGARGEPRAAADRVAGETASSGKNIPVASDLGDDDVIEFARSESQRELRDVVRAFAAVEIAPFAQEADRLRTIPAALGERFQNTGVARQFLSPDRPYLNEICMVTEELGYACAACASYLMLPVFFNRFLLRFLEPNAAARLRAELDEGQIVTSFAASEREAGSDLQATAVTVERTSSGYRLNGRKEYSSNARHARQVIVVARGPSLAGVDAGPSALSWLLVPTNAAGVTVGPRWDTFGLRALDVSPFDFVDVDLPPSALLGAEGGGLQLLSHNLAQSRTGIAALAVGIARRARDLVVEFANRRQIYGQKLNRLQDYRFRIADMETDISAARGLVAASAEKYDRGLDHNKEASMAKLYAGQMVMRVTEAASAMLGSIGYTGQTVAEKLLRDARHVAIVEGPEPIHREIVFMEMLRRGAA
jgi:alkylation response protein AidB-like acyl-CoA dehydrogenase